MTWANYLADQSKAFGYDPVDIATAMHYETGGSMNPNIWGGKGNNYFGLIQFGPEERQKYGVTPGQTTPEQQVDATLNFLRDRGFKPGMGLLDLYSTINAGSPGHYSASDRPGATVSSHVSAMGPHREAALQFLGGAVPEGLLSRGAAAPARAPEYGGGAVTPSETTASTAQATAAPASTPPTAPAALNFGKMFQGLMAAQAQQDAQAAQEHAARERAFQESAMQHHLRYSGLLGRG